MRSSIRSSIRAELVLIGPAMNNLSNHPSDSPSSSSFPLRFLLRFFRFSEILEGPGRELAYDSGSSAKLMRLGVDKPEGGLLPRTLATPFPNISERLPVLGDERGVEGTEGTFKEECVGGEGGRVEDECLPLVKRRDIEAVAVDVPATGAGTGVTGMKLGDRLCLRSFRGGELMELGGGCSSRILRRD